jgi:3-phosphoshikimate 1-carboxyvinyltransferase
MNFNLRIRKNQQVGGTVSGLPASKSVSNRVLVLDALAGYGSELKNLSEARDTQLMQKLVKSSDKVIDVMDAGTTMRFLTAFYAISGSNRIMTGTDRMKERPISPLVNTLREIGADIRYLGKDGYPPLEILGFSGQRTREVTIPGNLSSQFISALMMIAPVLPLGLRIQLSGHVGSRPYIKMTQEMIRMFGGKIEFERNLIEVSPGGLKKVNYAVEPDWSAASYWFSFCGLSEQGEFYLPGNFSQSFQGDQVITDIGKLMGIESARSAEGLSLKKSTHQNIIEWDFTDCPDLAQTVAPLCAFKGISGIFTGLESLRIKETDRIAALQQELAQSGATLEETTTGVWKLTPAKRITDYLFEVKTYHDHRMAMGFAPLATHLDVAIEDRNVVNKSYPRFWTDLQSVGFDLDFRDPA